jgi:uncharacterized protein (TIGR00369 family)
VEKEKSVGSGFSRTGENEESVGSGFSRTGTGELTASALAELRSTMSGLEFFRQMMTGAIPPPPLLVLLKIRLTQVEPGNVVFEGVAEEAFYNGLGMAHGGYAATMLDSALGCAINSVMPAGRRFTTLELKINYTRPLRKELGTLRCEAHVVHAGNRTATSEGRIVDASGKIYAHGTTTCILIDP